MNNFSIWKYYCCAKSVVLVLVNVCILDFLKMARRG